MNLGFRGVVLLLAFCALPALASRAHGEEPPLDDWRPTPPGLLSEPTVYYYYIKNASPHHAYILLELDDAALYVNDPVSWTERDWTERREILNVAADSFLFTRDHGRLRMRINRFQAAKSKEHATRQGWYVTADYSTDPPGVTLTKEPGKYSDWELVWLKGTEEPYLRNRNDLKKPRWLDAAKEWTPAIISGQHCRLHRPILSDRPAFCLSPKFVDGK